MGTVSGRRWGQCVAGGGDSEWQAVGTVSGSHYVQSVTGTGYSQ